MISYRPGLEELPVYDTAERQWEVKLDANESTLNLPYNVLERVQDRLSFLPFNLYPDTAAPELCEQIAEAYRLAPQQVVMGNGSSELLEKLFFAFGGPGRSIVYPAPSFAMYPIFAKVTESIGVPVPLEADYSLSPDKLLAAAAQCQAKLIILCTPNNPTGTVMPKADVEKIVANAPCPVVVDEAYQEFCGETAVDLLDKYPNLIVARTFSKAYALAAARVGYLLLAEKIANQLRKTLMPYYLNSMTQAVASVVFMMRHEFDERIAVTIQERESMAAVLAEMPDITVYPSGANFLFIQVAGAAELVEFLGKRNIGVRAFNDPALKDCIRITIGTPLENERVIEGIHAWCERRG